MDELKNQMIRWNEVRYFRNKSPSFQIYFQQGRMLSDSFRCAKKLEYMAWNWAPISVCVHSRASSWKKSHDFWSLVGTQPMGYLRQRFSNYHASEFSGGLVKTDCWLQAQSFWSSRYGVELRICISNKFPGDANAPVWGSHLENTWVMAMAAKGARDGVFSLSRQVSLALILQSSGL